MTNPKANGDGINVSVMYNDQVAVDTALAQPGSDVENVLREPKGTQHYEHFTSDNYRAVKFYRSLSGTELTGLPAGDLWVDVYTDFNPDSIVKTVPIRLMQTPTTCRMLPLTGI